MRYEEPGLTSSPRRPPKSKYYGISWHTRDKRWRVRAKYHNGYEWREKLVANLRNEREAAMLYDAAARVLGGRLRKFNFSREEITEARIEAARALLIRHSVPVPPRHLKRFEETDLHKDSRQWLLMLGTAGEGALELRNKPWLANYRKLTVNKHWADADAVLVLNSLFLNNLPMKPDHIIMTPSCFGKELLRTIWFEQRGLREFDAYGKLFVFDTTETPDDDTDGVFQQIDMGKWKEDAVVSVLRALGVRELFTHGIVEGLADSLALQYGVRVVPITRHRGS